MNTEFNFQRPMSPPRRVVSTPDNTPPRRYSSPVSGSGRRSSSSLSDRFIPSRLSTNLEDAFDLLENKIASKDQNMKNDVAHEKQIAMNNLLRSELLGQQIEYSLDNRLSDGQIRSSPARKESSVGNNLFKFRSPQKSLSSDDSSSDLLGSSVSLGQSPSRLLLNSPSKKTVRKISKTPYKVLDAPALQDDYYLNLVDWSHSNVLSVALGSSVYLWSAHTSKVSKLCDLDGEDDSVTSLSWALSGNNIAVGTNSGKILIYDTVTNKVVREMEGHESRVGTLAWSSSLLASGSRDRRILCQDIRVRGAHGSSGTNSSGSSSNTRSNRNSSVGGNSRGGSDAHSRNSSASGMTSRDHSRDSHLSARAAADLAAGLSGDSRLSSVSLFGPESDDLPNDLDSGFSIFRDGAGRSSSLLSSETDHDFDPPGFGGLSDNSFSRRQSLSSTLSMSVDGSVHSSGGSNPSVVKEFVAHKQEVCGLKWSFDEKMLASGGNDNKLFIWDAGVDRSQEPICRFEDHIAAVKAVAWSPHQHGLVASGGGTADRHIRFWNANTALPLHKIDTGSQVCNLMWSKNVNEIVSTHGYSLNQVIVWKYPSMQKVATLTGHTMRVLYLAMSPDGQSVVTGAGDETLRFWNLFPGARSKTGSRLGPSLLSPVGMEIR